MVSRCDREVGMVKAYCEACEAMNSGSGDKIVYVDVFGVRQGRESPPEEGASGR